MTDHLVRFRGTIRGLNAHGSTLLFGTEHDEGQPTALFAYDVASKKLNTYDIGCGSTAQCAGADAIWVAGTDNVLRRGKHGAKLAAIGDAFDKRIAALAPCGAGVVVVSGDTAHLVDAKGKRSADFDLGEPGRSVAVDPTGHWIVVGTTRGHVCVFSDADGDWAQVSRTRMHDGQVTALAFSPDELRVYSTGSDRKLLVSFVRGAHDTEDRGGNNMHDREALAILIGPTFETADGSRARFYTAGMDASIKSWPRGRGGSQRPATWGDGVVQTHFLALIELDGKPHIAAAGSNTIRIFAFSDDGKVGDRVHSISDAYAMASASLDGSKPKDRQSALEELSTYADARAVDLIASHVEDDESDHKLRVKGTELLASISHRHTADRLRNLLDDGSADVRAAAFAGLQQIEGASDADLLREALQNGAEDLGLRAVQAGAGSDVARDIAREALDHDAAAVRLAALTLLEKEYGDDPEGTLAGLTSSHAETRRLAIVRLQQRKLVGQPVVDARLRRLWDDDDDRARLFAFVVAAHRSTKLVAALRAADDDFNRQVFELEEFGKDEKKRRKEVPKAKAADPSKLAEADFRPLLEAMSSRSVDVSLRGARGLAALGDERAFGTLLQLSRESEPSARIAACKALAVLEDPRATRRMRAMLHDDDSGVRAAAFSALSALQSDQPLQASRAGLSAPQSDVRERALALLVRHVKKAKKNLTDEARDLMITALNDAEASIRQEAFKSVLGIGPEGEGVPTLRFILQSVHSDVRNEVLQEAKAKPKDAEYRGVVLSIIDDADVGNRSEALNHALDKWPSKEHEAVFKAGLQSRYANQRVATVAKLSEQKGEIRNLLVGALEDAETDVRLAAVRALVAAGNRDLLVQALDSDHVDVRVEAASALAVIGEDRALAALTQVCDTFSDMVAKNATDADIEAYKPRLQTALTGIANLGHPDSLASVERLLAGDEAIAKGAAATLPAIAHPTNLDRIRDIARHEIEGVRLLAALALAYNGDGSRAGAIFGHTSSYFELFAALGLRAQSQERLLSYVDSSDAKTASVALAIALALELSEHTDEGVPQRCLSLLSARDPSVRLRAAEALEHYSEQPSFYQWVYQTLNGLSGTTDAWSAEPRQLLLLSRALTFGEPRLAIRAANILAQLVEPKRDEFDRLIALFEARFVDELERLEKLANTNTTAPLSERVASAWRRVKAKISGLSVEPKTFAEALTALSFGAYIGLVRQGKHAARGAAITGLVRLAPTNDRLAADARSVLLLALGDPHADVRIRAFEALQRLSADSDVLATEALSTGYADMGRRGLELLAANAKQGNALLEKTLLESTNGLEEQAAALLVDRVGQLAVHKLGVGAASESFRAASVRGLSREAGKDEAAKALRGALGSKYEDVRDLAAVALANRKDTAAFDALVDMLDDEDGSRSYRGIAGLRTLQDPRAAGVLLDRIDADTDEDLDAEEYFDAAVSLNDPSIAPRLVSMIDRGHHAESAFDAALQLSGYKQYEWMDDDEVTPQWEAELKPLHPDVFAEIFDLAYRIGDADMLGNLVGFAKWPAKNDDIDRSLAALLSFTDDNVRTRAVEIVGWRLRHREGPADGLRQKLQAREPLEQFYAAEGLALAGHDDGLAVLRTAIDAIGDWDAEERAITALGVLADPSTVDMLLEIANDDSHNHNSTAVEAIGHMSGSERADEVFATLKRIVAQEDYDTIEESLRGLRWFGTPGAWEILRASVENDWWYVVQTAVDALRYDPDPRGEEAILVALRTNDDWDVAQSAYASLKHRYGPDSLEPDYLLMESCVGGLDEHDEALDRLRQSGDVGRLLETLSRIHEDNIDDLAPKLVAIVLSRDPLPVDDAATMLSADAAQIGAVAAQIVGRAGADAAKKHGKALAAATKATRERWEATWADFTANREGARDKLRELEDMYRRQLWACARLKVGADELLAAAQLADHTLTQAIRTEAMMSVGEEWVGKKGITLLEQLASGRDARLRSTAAAELERNAPKVADKLLADSVHDDVTYGRMLPGLDPKDQTLALRDVVHAAPGLSLPRLAALGDIDGLVAAMRNANLADETRHGAIDALSTIPSTDAADKLAAFGADDDQDEMLRKAAWRARRRVSRAVAAQERT